MGLKILILILSFSIGKISGKNFKKHNSNATLILKYNFNKTNNQNIGDPFLIFYNIYKNTPKYEFGISGLKKHGEKISLDISNNRYLLSTTSIYFTIKNIKIQNLYIKNIILGNFQISYGQGIILNFANKFQKPIDAIKIFNKQKGLKKCKSHDKTKFLGIAIDSKCKNLENTIFISNNYYDGIIKNNKIFSLKRREKYNTEKNLNKKNNIHNFSTGFATQIKTHEIIDIGLIYTFSHFNKEFKLANHSDLKTTNLKNIDNLLKEKNLHNTGFFINIICKKLKIYTDFAISSPNLNENENTLGYAYIIGSKINLNKHFKYVNIFRNYSKNFHNLYGKSFGTGEGLVYKKFKGNINNEIGLYNAIQLKLKNNITTNLSLDIVAIPERTFNFTKSNQKIIILDIFHKLKKYINYYKLQFRYNNKKHIIITKDLHYKNTNDNNFLLKFILKKNKFIQKTHTNITSKTNGYFTININTQKNYKSGCAIYEKLSIKHKRTDNTLHIIICKTTENTPIYILNRQINNYKKNIIKLIENEISISYSLNIKVTKKMKIQILYKLTTMLANKYICNKLNLGVNYKT